MMLNYREYLNCCANLIPLSPLMDRERRMLLKYFNPSRLQLMHCPLRNRASLAHANELLDEPEATVALNAVYTIFRYIQDCIKRFGNA
ncbi:abortive infection family protein [Halomonas sp. PA5]|uniref:abortive infection family protein n=1 Tax=Halomonas sp. PA5 TaxID=2730357 RepID=UPI00349FC51F